jgi:hypothetical protein
MKADRPPGKTDDVKAAGDEAAMPPARSDVCEGQNGRTDKEREGRRRKDDERRRRGNDDWRWW